MCGNGSINGYMKMISLVCALYDCDVVMACRSLESVGGNVANYTVCEDWRKVVEIQWNEYGRLDEVYTFRINEGVLRYLHEDIQYIRSN
jgi:hypothetical protein